MTTVARISAEVNLDQGVDKEIEACLTGYPAKSFFLFAGAGSGKTRSLVKALENTLKARGHEFWLQGQKISVITYTNAAADEIVSRVKANPLVDVSTIHSFIWKLIKGFDADIKAWLKQDLQKDLIELNSKSSRPGTKAEIDRINSIASKTKRLATLDSVTSFVYSPTGDNRGNGSLNHSEVISMGAEFLSFKPLLQEILICQSPVLLVDESQDTNKHLIKALFDVQAAHPDRFSLGLLGDTMQRIYADGEKDLGKNLPPDWATPEKKMNFRCPPRVVRLINAIRSTADDQKQTALEDKPEGFVRLFVVDSETTEKVAVEKYVAERMANLTADNKWAGHDAEVKTLILEHHMAARRLNFIDMYEALYRNTDLRIGLLDGTLNGLKFFIDLVLPIAEAKTPDDFKVAAVVRKYSPFLVKERLATEKNPTDLIDAAYSAVTKIHSLAQNGRVTFLELLNCVAETKLFEIPSAFKPIVARTLEDSNIVDAELLSSADEFIDDIESSKDNKASALDNWDQFLRTSFRQIIPYRDYINGDAGFDTHQGVKGLEFERVLVIIDDKEARGFLFSYDKLFGASDKTPQDLKNEQEGKETTIDRTRRLLYVTCSRAESSLAIIAYSKNPASVKRTAVEQDWFKQDEVEIVLDVLL